jgi:hypothetical protein
MTFAATSAFSLLWATQPSPNLVFGFTATNTTSSTSVTSSQACQLNSPLTCNISIRELDSAVYTGTTMLASTFLLPSGSSYVNVYEPTTKLVTVIQPCVFNRFYIKLTDMDGNVMNMSNSDWQFSMTLHTEEELKKRMAEDDGNEKSGKRFVSWWFRIKRDIITYDLILCFQVFRTKNR